MPTGYTDKINKGCTFEEFAMNCMKAMGACKMLRESNEMPTPENVKSKESKDDGHHQKELKKAMVKNSQSDDVILMGFTKYKEDKIKELEEDLVKNQKQIDSYTAMLDKVLALKVPTNEHQGWQDFMVKQIEDSIEWDDSSSYTKERLHAVKLLTPEKYLSERRESIQWNIDYHTKNDKRDDSNDEARSLWVKQALEAIGVSK